MFTVEVGVRPFGGDWLVPEGVAEPFAPLGQVSFE